MLDDNITTKVGPMNLPPKLLIIVVTNVIENRPKSIIYNSLLQLKTDTKN